MSFFYRVPFYLNLFTPPTRVFFLPCPFLPESLYPSDSCLFSFRSLYSFPLYPFLSLVGHPVSNPLYSNVFPHLLFISYIHPFRILLISFSFPFRFLFFFKNSLLHPLVYDSNFLINNGQRFSHNIGYILLTTTPQLIDRILCENPIGHGLSNGLNWLDGKRTRPPHTPPERAKQEQGHRSRSAVLVPARLDSLCFRFSNVFYDGKGSGRRAGGAA